MSNWASVEIGGEGRDAWEYRAIFLKYGIKYENFYCPYCDIRLCARLVYSDGELSKSPHFSARWEDHINGCNGEPLEVNVNEKKPTEAHYKPREMHFPEAFIDRPPPRVEVKSLGNNNAIPPSSLEVHERRKKAASLGRPIPKTYLLQPIVEAYNSVWKEGYERAKIEHWTDAVRIRWTKSALAEMPLRLEDVTNYESGFCSPLYRKSFHPRIYQGVGSVRIHDELFIIDNKFSKNITSAQHPFRIVVERDVVNESSPKSHIEMLNILSRYSETSEEVRWYAYGLPVCFDAYSELLINNIDYLYLKKSYLKK